MLPACAPFLQHLGSAVFAQARALGVAFALHASSLVEPSNTGTLEMALGNTATKAFFKPLSSASLTMSAAVLDGAVTPDKGTRLGVQDWEDALSRLGGDEALLVTYTQAQPLRTCLLSLENPMPDGQP